MDNNAYMHILNDQIKNNLKDMKGKTSEQQLEAIQQGKNVMYQFIDFHFLDNKQFQDMRVKKQGQDIRVMKSYQTKKHEQNIQQFHLEKRIKQDKVLKKDVKNNSKTMDNLQFAKVVKPHRKTPELTNLIQNDLYSPKYNRSFSVKRELNQNKQKYKCQTPDTILERFVKTSIQKPLV